MTRSPQPEKGKGKGKGKSKTSGLNQRIEGACRRCGRWGHMASNCFATIHMVQEYASQVPILDEDYEENLDENYEENYDENYQENLEEQ
eukprot:4694598-Heterocapsa_arctica.AAC.1